MIGFVKVNARESECHFTVRSSMILHTSVLLSPWIILDPNSRTQR